MDDVDPRMEFIRHLILNSSFKDNIKFSHNISLNPYPPAASHTKWEKHREILLSIPDTTDKMCDVHLLPSTTYEYTASYSS